MLRIRKLTLRQQFLMALAGILLLSGVVSYRFSSWYQEDVTQTLGLRLVERNVLYEKSKLQTLISREVVLVQKMASSPVLKQWIQAEQASDVRARALAELEDYRHFFQGRRYFFAIAGSGNYYFKDDKSTGDANRPLYTLQKTDLKDGWFYAILGRIADVQLNVETDIHVNKTLVWINAVVHDAQRHALAVVGTGLDLPEVLQSVESRSVEVEGQNMLVDANGAIQLHPNIHLIDFASIRKAQTGESQSTIFSLVSATEDQARLRQLMAELKSGERVTASMTASIDGRSHMVALAWVPEIQWFVVSIIAPSVAMSASHFPSGLLLAGGLLVAALVLAAIWFESGLLRRLVRLDKAAQAIAKGDFTVRLESTSEDEIGRVAKTFLAMSRRIERYTDDLRRQVAERTAELVEKNRELETLSTTDPLTGLANRLRLDDLLANEQAAGEARGTRFSVILIDIDKFKSVNDTYGHQVGDVVLVRISRLLEQHVRVRDVVGRWGGEEFLVICPDADAEEAGVIAERLRQAMAECDIAVTGPKTGSFGVSTYVPGDSIQSMIARADTALYRAKESGRNRVESG